ncbi:MAG: hypothetical protein ACP5IA_12025 [Sediminispirochaetaceae bacterium]
MRKMHGIFVHSLALTFMYGCVLLTAVNLHVYSETTVTMKEKHLITYGTWTAAGTALALSTYLFIDEIWFPSDEPYSTLFIPGSETWKEIAVAVPSIIVFTAASAWAMNTCLKLYTKWQIKKPWSPLVGIACGIAAGAVIGAAGLTTTICTGDALNVIDTGTMPNLLAGFGMSILAGGFWGGLFGIVPGLVIGPGISFYMDY